MEGVPIEDLGDFVGAAVVYVFSSIDYVAAAFLVGGMFYAIDAMLVHFLPKLISETDDST